VSMIEAVAIETGPSRPLAVAVPLLLVMVVMARVLRSIQLFRGPHSALPYSAQPHPLLDCRQSRRHQSTTICPISWIQRVLMFSIYFQQDSACSILWVIEAFQVKFIKIWSFVHSPLLATVVLDLRPAIELIAWKNCHLPHPSWAHSS